MTVQEMPVITPAESGCIVYCIFVSSVVIFFGIDRNVISKNWE